MESIMTNFLISPSISLVDNRPAVSSLAIAEHFGKRHGDVLNSIRKIGSECPQEFNERNFSLVKYIDAKGEERDSFEVFRDGFMLVVMSYTGSKAMQLKIAYITRFNEMEQALRIGAPALPTLSRLSLPSDPERKELTAMINAWVGCAPIHYAAARSIVNAHIGVKSIDEMTVEQVKDAITFVTGKIYEVQNIPVATPTLQSSSTVTAMRWEKELHELHHEALEKSAAFLYWLNDIDGRLNRVTGPLYKATVLKLVEGDKSTCTDRGIAALHEGRHEVSDRLRDSMKKFTGGIWQAAFFAKAIQK